MKIVYNNLTEDQLEEWVEFIDWSLVSSSLLIEDIKKKFSPTFKGLQIRIWFEDLLSSFEVRVDEKEYPDYVFFFKGEEVYMELNEKSGVLWCSHDRIWSVFYSIIGRKYDETQRFIKNVVEIHFKNREVAPQLAHYPYHIGVEIHFKDMEVTPMFVLMTKPTEVENHFKN